MGSPSFKSPNPDDGGIAIFFSIDRVEVATEVPKGRDADSGGAMEDRSPIFHHNVVERLTTFVDPWLRLTPREQEIVRLVSRGLVNKQIAEALRISRHTVDTHLRRIFAKLAVDTRAEMVSLCWVGVHICRPATSRPR
ncbi:MAG: helix-turn-helix transcriptional regulator [Myxococcota bacterium]